MSKASAAGTGTEQKVPARNPKVKPTYKTLLNKRGELSSFRCALFFVKIFFLLCLFMYIPIILLDVCFGIDVIGYVRNFVLSNSFY